MNRSEFGKIGEDFVERYFKLHGYKILERNFKCRLGEIDIICQRDEEISFIEVKARSGDTFGTPAESVNKDKIKRIKNAAKLYLMINDIGSKTIKFDVVEIYLNHLKEAF